MASIRIIDDHGLLSSNPDKWPNELKAAIAQCCCERGSSVPATVDNPCCKDLKLPVSLRGSIRNTKVHDTGLSLTYHSRWVEKGPGWPPWQSLDPWLNAGYVEGHPPGIPLEGVLDARETLNGPFGGGILVRTEGGAAWWSDLYEDFSSSHELDGVFWVKLFPPFGAWLPINYHISMTIQNYFYVVVNQEYWSTFPIVGWQPTCNMSLVQLSYPVGRVTYTGIPVGPFGYPAETPIDWTVGNAMSSLNLLGGFRQRSSIMRSYTGGVNDEFGCSGFYQINYKGLSCNPFDRIHVFEGANGLPIDPQPPFGSRQILARQPAIQAVVVPQPNPNAGQLAGGAPGWILTNPLTDDDYENYKLLNPPNVCPLVFDPNPEPHMEAFV